MSNNTMQVDPEIIQQNYSQRLASVTHENILLTGALQQIQSKLNEAVAENDRLKTDITKLEADRGTVHPSDSLTEE